MRGHIRMRVTRNMNSNITANQSTHACCAVTVRAPQPVSLFFVATPTNNDWVIAEVLLACESVSVAIYTHIYIYLYTHTYTNRSSAVEAAKQVSNKHVSPMMAATDKAELKGRSALLHTEVLLLLFLDSNVPFFSYPICPVAVAVLVGEVLAKR